MEHIEAKVRPAPRPLPGRSASRRRGWGWSGSPQPSRRRAAMRCAGGGVFSRGPKLRGSSVEGVEVDVADALEHGVGGASAASTPWLDGRTLGDATLASYLAELHDQSRALAGAATTVVAACSGLTSLAGRVRPRGTAGAGPRRLPADRRPGAKRGRSRPRTWPPSSVKAAVARAIRTLRAAAEPRRRGTASCRSRRRCCGSAPGRRPGRQISRKARAERSEVSLTPTEHHGHAEGLR